jgi:methyl acetate hydrolase
VISYRILVTVICALACVSCTPPKHASPIDAVLESAVDSGRIPGVIAVAATSDGIIYQGAAGNRDMSSGSEMTFDTIVQITSMTKAVTSVAVMQLVEQGEIELDQPVSSYLPRFAGVEVLERFDADNQPILRAAKSPVTIRQLLTHTSGYVYEIWNADSARYVASGSVASVFDGGDDFIDAPLFFDPGTEWEYGISTDILGVLVEVISGQSLDDYFRDHIFSPLGMKDTHFVLPEEKLSRLATVYAKSSDGGLTPIPYSRPSEDFFSGGAGLSSTAGDYIRFLRALLNEGELDGARILGAATVDLMAQNHIGELEAADSFISLAPGLSNDFDLIPDSEDKFGLGFLINSEPIPGGRSTGSLAWAGLYNTYFWIDREQNLCGVLVTQILPFYDADVVGLLNRFETAVYTANSATKN